MLLIEAAAQAPIGAVAGIPTGGMGASAPIIDNLRVLQGKSKPPFWIFIAMEPRALAASSGLAFVEHERGRGIYD